MHIILRTILGFSVVATLAMAGALLLFANPLADDFCHASNVRELGLFRCVSVDYAQWGGRWASTLLACTFPWLFNVTQWYSLPLLGILIAMLLGTRLLLAEVLELRDRPRQAWGLSLVVLSLYWAGMPHPGQSIYWLEGAWVYSLNLSLGMMLFVGLLRLPAPGSPGWSLRVAGLALLAFFLAAFHELFTFVQIGLLVVGAALAFRWGDGRRYAWAIVGIATLLGFATVLVAPGNEARQDFATGNVAGGSPLRALQASVAMAVRILDAPSLRDRLGSNSPLGWVLDPKLLAATVLLVVVPSMRSLRPSWLERDAALWRLLIPGTCIAFLGGSFVAGGWALGRTMPLRAFNGLYLVFLLGWLLTALVYTRDRGEVGTPRAETAFLRTVSVLILALGLMGSTNLKLGLRDLATGRASAFDREMERRYAAAPAAREGGRPLVAERVNPWPSSYFQFDVDRTPENLQQCVARFLDVSSIQITESGAGTAEGDPL
ncbi:MAG: DUF6056 family protein [Myxococcota bacterium]